MDNTTLLQLFPWVPRPFLVLCVLAAAIAVAIVIHAVLWALFKRFLSTRYPLLHDIVRRTRAISRFAFIMVALSIAL